MAFGQFDQGLQVWEVTVHGKKGFGDNKGVAACFLEEFFEVVEVVVAEGLGLGV